MAIIDKPVEAATYPGPSSQEALRRLAMLLATGWLVTNLALSINELPLTFLLKDQLKMDAAAVSMFFFLGNFTNYIKPLAGILTDSVPFLGTRRRHYLLLGVGGGGIFWLLLGMVPRTHFSLLLTYTLFYVTVVLTSTSLGGRMVEVGQEHGAAGRLTAQRIGTFRIAALAGGVIGGWLSTKSYIITVVIGATLHFGLFTLLYKQMTEKRAARLETGVLREAGRQIRALLSSRTLMFAALMIFLIAVSPGFGTPLLYYQTNTLKFSKPFVGLLGSMGAGCGLIAAWFYFAYCRMLPMRALLKVSIVLHALGTLCYLMYHSHLSAILITCCGGISGTLAQLPVYDLAARATPRGSEAVGYAVMMSVWNFTNALSNWTGSKLFDCGFTFGHLVWLNAGTTALVLLFVPFLPAVLLAARDGESTGAVVATAMAE